MKIRHSMTAEMQLPRQNQSVDGAKKEGIEAVAVALPKVIHREN